jgi:hypothetical protein
MRIFLGFVAACAVVLVFFFGTLFILDHYDFPPRDPLAREAESLRNALHDYHRDHLAYPIMQDNPISDIKKVLIAGGYFSGLPADPDNDARYVSPDGKKFGLLFHINRSASNAAGDKCLIEVEVQRSGWWGQPPKCSF